MLGSAISMRVISGFAKGRGGHVRSCTVESQVVAVGFCLCLFWHTDAFNHTSLLTSSRCTR
jgi:hypothetical protein